MKNRYFERVEVLKGQRATFYLPLQVQPIVNGENGEPRDIEATDVEDLRVRISYVGETGNGKEIPFETIYNMVVVNVPAQEREGDLTIIVSGKYGQVCLRAEVVCVIGKRGGVGGVLPAYVSPVVGDCGTIAEIAPLPLCFTNNGDNSVGLGLTIYNDDEDDPEWHPNLQISYNGIDWRNVEDDEFMTHDDQTYPFALAPHGSIYFRGMNPDGVNVDSDDFDINKFMSFEWSHDETEVSLSGDIMALVNYEKRVDVPQNENKCFIYIFGQYDSDNMCPITDASGLVPFFSVAFSSCISMFYGLKHLVNAPALPATALADNCYSSMFYDCTSLVSAPALPATELADNCYASMFERCASLVSAPALPATTLANNCYRAMFNGCTALVNAPALPATELASDCYASMFSDCTSLVSAPALPATTLVGYCYQNMFSDCTALVNAPALPATELASDCYRAMFYGCTSLVNAPALPATTLAKSCYYEMFYGCEKLVTAPALPATTLVGYCYQNMFSGCTSLVTAPALPATTLANNCYRAMFYGCTSLVNAPALPATELAEYCYYAMFERCVSLVSAPVLPATSLVSHCYELMFHICTLLKSIEMYAVELSPANAVTNWVQGVPAGHIGTFTKNDAATWTTTGNSGVPTGWGIIYKEV